MTILDVGELFASGGVDDDGHRFYDVAYQVRSNTRSDGPARIIQDLLSPVYGTHYRYGGGAEQDFGAFARRYRIDPVDAQATLKVWRLMVHYNSRPTRKPDVTLFTGGTTGTNDPTQLVRVRGSFVPYSEPFTRDITQTPVTNAAGDLFLGLQIDRNRPTLILEKTFTVAAFNSLASTILRAVSRGRLNRETFWYNAERTWKLDSAPWQEVYYGQANYVEVAFQFTLKEDGWDYEPANRGPRYKDGTTYKRFTDDLGLDYGGDGLGALNDDGTRRDETEDPKIIYYDGAATDSAGEPFKGYSTIDFADTFSLPSSL